VIVFLALDVVVAAAHAEPSLLLCASRQILAQPPPVRSPWGIMPVLWEMEEAQLTFMAKETYHILVALNQDLKGYGINLFEVREGPAVGGGGMTATRVRY
jgi:hypothetical protein